MASFRKRSNKWEYRIKYTDPATKKKKEKTKGGFKTKKEAQLAAADVESKLFFGGHTLITGQKLLIKDWLSEWLSVYGNKCSARTLENRETHINKHLVPNLGYYKLSELSRLDYQKFINELAKKYSKESVRNIHTTFNSAINKAVELEMITHNKYRNISIQKANDIAHTKTNYLTKEQVKVFMDEAKKAKIHHYIVASLLLRTGMRKGEMIALTWNDINFEHKTISITKTRDDFGERPPKTKKSIRTISIDDTLIADLKRYRTWQKEYRLKKGPNYKEKKYLLVGLYGEELTSSTVNKIITSIAKKSNLHHISPHGLRHTHAIMLLESGADIKFVSDRLGHTTVKMTADVYIHITKKYEQENILKLESYLNN
ncbi:tyrosine-type recombinase/integrase [Priestia megaterium]|uniref:tyrosine-type recombinase/integrase n=1 Tax=Priestia megaterium TaxID=1404 RepID=UPI001BE98CCB|nr:site-specific integrase [Priestia megaterium]MBT2254009.1 site-specific integrase [Priestia megaterium]MBT2279262.1 site-specific integrase [Priestia megaterium]